MKDNPPELTDREFWEDSWRQSRNLAHQETLPLPGWLEILDSYLSPKQDWEFFEVGCYPGRFLAYFHTKFGFKPSGIDYLKGTKEIEEYLKKRNIDFGEILDQDFFQLQVYKQYDVVGSFGFIEHFNNTDQVIEKHISLVKPGGLIIIEIPNLTHPLYRLLHPGIIRGHNLKVMNRDVLKNHLESRGFKVLYCDNYLPPVTSYSKFANSNIILKYGWICLKRIHYLLYTLSKRFILHPVVDKFFYGYFVCVARNKVSY